MPRQVCINCGSIIIKLNGEYKCPECGRRIKFEEDMEEDVIYDIEDKLYAK